MGTLSVVVPDDERPAIGPARRVRQGRAVSKRTSPAVAPPGQLRVRLLLAYHGAPFHGIAPQVDGVHTVGNALTAALCTVLRQAEPPFLTMAGRTDAGVHAHGQVVHVDVIPSARGYDWAKVQRSLNQMLGPDIVIRAVGSAPEGFDARRSAIWRRYRYTILNTVHPDPLGASTVWHVPETLDRRALALASDPFLGEHDFTSFCRRPRGLVEPSMTRTVLEAHWTELGEGRLRFEIRATSFCQQMVRAIVGFLVEVGRGRRHAGEVLEVLRSCDRARAAPIAPPTGLVLWEVGYPDGLTFIEDARGTGVHPESVASLSITSS